MKCFRILWRLPSDFILVASSHQEAVCYRGRSQIWRSVLVCSALKRCQVLFAWYSPFYRITAIKPDLSVSHCFWSIKSAFLKLSGYFSVLFYLILLTTSFSEQSSLVFLQLLAPYFCSSSWLLIHLPINIDDSRSSTFFLLSYLVILSLSHLIHLLTLNELKVKSTFLGEIYAYNTSNPLLIWSWMPHRYLWLNTLKTYFPSKVALATLS